MNIGVDSGSNFTTVQLGQVKMWFSYHTLIGLAVNGKRIVHENTWGPTTGKHLNAIDGGDNAEKAKRLDGTAFEAQARVMLAAEGIQV